MIFLVPALALTFGIIALTNCPHNKPYCKPPIVRFVTKVGHEVKKLK